MKALGICTLVFVMSTINVDATNKVAEQQTLRTEYGYLGTWKLTYEIMGYNLLVDADGTSYLELLLSRDTQPELLRLSEEKNEIKAKLERFLTEALSLTHYRINLTKLRGVSSAEKTINWLKSLIEGSDAPLHLESTYILNLKEENKWGISYYAPQAQYNLTLPIARCMPVLKELASNVSK